MTSRPAAKRSTPVAPIPGAATPCRCGSPGDYKCERRQVGPATTVRRGGQKVIVQPYVVFYSCAECIAAHVTSDDPPRLVKALPHQAAFLKRQTDEATKALIGETHEDRLGDWGRP